jgi:acetylornithine deacetylase/succinyl-diaminopimelate desuccinylase-like protein
MTLSKSLALFIFAGLNVLAIADSNAQKTIPKTIKKEKANSSVDLYQKYIDDHHDEHLKEFVELVSIPSISSIPSHKADMERAASFIVQKLRAIGLTTARLIPTEGNPVVFGSWEQAPGKPTVLIYAHYDVQPVNESEWDHPPFSPIITDGKIIGRGASDDKSGVMTTIWAMEAMLRTDGKLPVNVKFMFEGDEEVGSPYFESFLQQNKELLKADFALNADDGQFDENTPSVTISLRGSVHMQFSVKTADTDAHSGEFGGKTPNAAMIMSQLISSFYDNAGNVAVEGFYDKVIPVSAQQKEMIKKIPYDPATDMKILGTTAEAGDTSYSPLERVWYRPTLEIVGMQSGYTAAEGHSNIIPGHAMARITCRLVKNQDGLEIVDLIEKHIRKHCPAGATLTFKLPKGYAKPMSLPTDTKEYRYVAKVLSDIFGKEPLQYASGGSVGAMLTIKEVLGLYAYPLGFELSDEKWHAANEFFRVSSIKKMQLIYCRYLQHVAYEESKLKK